MSQPRSVRARAARLLAQVFDGGQGASLAQLLPAESHALPRPDAALLQELCYGVCRFSPRFEVMLEHFVSKKLKARDNDIRALLYLGFYQLLITRIPDHAAIGSTVEACRELGKGWAKGLINGVLRNCQRQSAPPQRWANDPRYRYSHPLWLYRALQTAWPDDAAATLDANNERGPMTLRVNQRQISRAAYLAALADAGIDARPCPYSPVGIELQKPCDPGDLPGFDRGQVSVQDEAAQLAAPLLDLQNTQRVLDACCAPGGKTCHLLEQRSDLRELVALDVDRSRLGRVEDNLARLQLRANLKTGDARAVTDWWDGEAFDRILLDAPCSATGVIRRHPDIKLLRRDSDIAKLAQLQSAMLAALWPTLAPGGLLLYATCSVLPAENEAVVAAFVEQTGDAQHCPLAVDWGRARPVGRQLFPQPQGHDGFYYALLQKTRQPEHQ